MPQPHIPYRTHPIGNANRRSEHYPFGMLMQGRGFEVGNGYRFGFNGMESNNHGQNIYTTYYRAFSASLCIWLSTDPKSQSYPAFTPYNFALNNPLVLTDPYGDDPITKNRKGDRSIRKYEKHFAKELQMAREANPTASQNALNSTAHSAVETKYNDKKWMWVHEMDGMDGHESNTTPYHNHAQYFHAGDLFIAKNPQFNVQTTTTTRIPAMLSRRTTGTFISPDGLSAIGFDSYFIPNAGVVSFSFSSSAGNWTYNIRQSNNSPGPQSYNDLINLASLSNDIVVSLGATTPFINGIDPLNGNTLYATYIPPAGGITTTGGLPINATLITTVTTTWVRRAQGREVLRSRDNHNPHRLSKDTLDRLQRSHSRQ